MPRDVFGFSCGAGSRLQGSRNDSAQLRFCLSRRRAPYHSSEQAVRNFASSLSCLVLRRWQLAAQPAQVIRCEGSEHCGWAQRTRHLYCQSVIDLVRLAAAYLAERFLNLLRMLAGCDAVCVQAVAVPARPDVGGRLVAPSTGAVAAVVLPNWPCG